MKTIKSNDKGIVEAKIKANFRNIHFHLFRVKDFLKTDSLMDIFELKLQLVV